MKKTWDTFMGILAKKMNITFFMENEVLKIFSFTNFFVGSNIFRENGENNFWRIRPFFRRWGYLTLKMNITFLYHELNAKYFHVKQFFQKKKPYSLRKLQETVSGTHLTIF